MAIMKDTQRFLHFNLEHTGSGEDNHYVDLGKLLSQANRRFYRQGMVYHVANIVFDDADGDADIDVCTAPNTWATQEAWRLGFKHWFQQQRAALDALGIEDVPTWMDFKLSLNADMETDTDQATLIDVNGRTFPTGDWDISSFEVPNDGGAMPTKADVVLMGPNAGSWPDFTQVSLLQELELLLSIPQEDPSFSANTQNTAYGLMSAAQPQPEVVHEVIENMRSENDFPPYGKTVLPGAGTAAAGVPSNPWVARTCMIKGGSSTSSPVAAVGGFAAPCGLLMIETNSSGDNSIGCTIELVPGEYKGVHAYPMRGGGF